MILTPDEQERIRWEDALDAEHWESSRWSEWYQVTFEHEGELWAFLYETPATEMQEGLELEDQEAYRVAEVPAVRYRRIDD